MIVVMTGRSLDGIDAFREELIPFGEVGIGAPWPGLSPPPLQRLLEHSEFFRVVPQLRDNEPVRLQREHFDLPLTIHGWIVAARTLVMMPTSKGRRRGSSQHAAERVGRGGWHATLGPLR